MEKTNQASREGTGLKILFAITVLACAVALALAGYRIFLSQPGGQQAMDDRIATINCEMGIWLQDVNRCNDTVLRDRYYVELAIQKHNLSICENVEDLPGGFGSPQYTKELCRFRVAKSSNIPLDDWEYKNITLRLPHNNETVVLEERSIDYIGCDPANDQACENKTVEYHSPNGWAGDYDRVSVYRGPMPSDGTIIGYSEAGRVANGSRIRFRSVSPWQIGSATGFGCTLLEYQDPEIFYKLERCVGSGTNEEHLECIYGKCPTDVSGADADSAAPHTPPASAERTLLDCQGLDDSGKANCYYQIAKATNDTSICDRFDSFAPDSITATGLSKEYCYRSLGYVAPDDSPYLAASDGAQALSPLRGTPLAGTELYRIQTGFYPSLANMTIRDQSASADFTYQEEQTIWADSDKFEPSLYAYSVRFLGNDYGIPVCTESSEQHWGNNESGNWAWCDNDYLWSSANHRLNISFLGSSWILSSMTPPLRILDNSEGAINGGAIRLAKEEKYDILSVGDRIEAGGIRFRMADVSVAVGPNNSHPAILDVLDANGTVNDQIGVNPGETYDYRSPAGPTVKLRAYIVGKGMTLSASWAELAIYSDEIELQDGQTLDLAPFGMPGQKAKVSLLWKNRDGYPTNSAQPDSLREIVLYGTGPFNSAPIVPVIQAENKTSAPAPPVICPFASTWMNVGDTGGIGDWKVRLADIGVATGENNTRPAILDVLDESGKTIGTVSVMPGQPFTFARAGDGKSIVIRVEMIGGITTLADKSAQVWVTPDTCPVPDPNPPQTEALDGFCPSAGWTIISRGEEVKIKDWTVRLKQVVEEIGSINNHPANLEVFDENNRSLGTYLIYPKQAFAVGRSSDGKSITLQVERSDPALTLNSQWVDIFGRSKNCSKQYFDAAMSRPEAN
ncbi:MAG: hypothetical protein V1728_05470 [Candidatus Micrarchaeota archaeon]